MRWVVHTDSAATIAADEIFVGILSDMAQSELPEHAREVHAQTFHGGQVVES